MSAEIATKAAAYVQSANIGTDRLPTADLATAVQDALRRFSAIRPRTAVKAIDGSGVSIFDLSGLSLTGWNENFSQVLGVVYPWEDDGLSDNELEADAWGEYLHPTNGKMLRLEVEPATGEQFLIAYSILHEDGTASPAADPSVPADLVDAVAKLAAANACLMMAARCADGKESTIGADSWNGVSASSQWSALGLKLEKAALQAIGAGDEGTEAPAASATAAYDRDKLTGHGLGRLIFGRRL